MSETLHLGRAGLIVSIIGLVLLIVTVLFPGLGWAEINPALPVGCVGLILGIVGAVKDEQKAAGIVAIVFGSINVLIMLLTIAMRFIAICGYDIYCYP